MQGEEVGKKGEAEDREPAAGGAVIGCSRSLLHSQTLHDGAENEGSLVDAKEREGSREIDPFSSVILRSHLSPALALLTALKAIRNHSYALPTPPIHLLEPVWTHPKLLPFPSLQRDSSFKSRTRSSKVSTADSRTPAGQSGCALCPRPCSGRLTPRTDLTLPAGHCPANRGGAQPWGFRLWSGTSARPDEGAGARLEKSRLEENGEVAQLVRFFLFPLTPSLPLSPFPLPRLCTQRRTFLTFLTFLHGAAVDTASSLSIFLSLLTRFLLFVSSFDHFTVDIENLDIHYIHTRSSRTDATPLILCHGWPGGFFEFLHTIKLLTEPQGDPASPAYHVVVPSMPGYAFSSPPPNDKWVMPDTARVFNKLMLGLGYENYVAQGGDWGSITARCLGSLHKENCVGELSGVFLLLRLLLLRFSPLLLLRLPLLLELSLTRPLSQESTSTSVRFPLPLPSPGSLLAPCLPGCHVSSSTTRNAGVLREAWTTLRKGQLLPHPFPSLIDPDSNCLADPPTALCRL